MAKTKKIEKEFVISDSSVNCYGFRLLTSGYQKEKYAKNPIGYHMHIREAGVVVRWEDLRVNGDAIVGKPVINLSNERGQQTVEEIENGFLNAASVGHIVALEWSEDPKDLLPGQTGPTITKWYNRECSLVDVPGNMNALVLFDKEGTEIKLADFRIGTPTITTTQKSDMKQIILTAAQLALLPNLKADATQEDVNTVLENLVAEAAKVPQLVQDLAAANTAKKNAEDALVAEKKATATQKVIDLMDKAVSENRCTKEAGELLKKTFEGKPDELAPLLATMQPYQSITQSVTLTDAQNKEVEKLMALSGDELFANGGLEVLKELSEASYKIKYKEWTGKDAPAAE